jgi:hypothetical protein
MCDICVIYVCVVCRCVHMDIHLIDMTYHVYVCVCVCVCYVILTFSSQVKWNPAQLILSKIMAVFGAWTAVILGEKHRAIPRSKRCVVILGEKHSSRYKLMLLFFV